MHLEGWVCSEACGAYSYFSCSAQRIDRDNLDKHRCHRAPAYMYHPHGRSLNPPPICWTFLENRSWRRTGLVLVDQHQIRRQRLIPTVALPVFHREEIGGTMSKLDSKRVR